MKKAFIVIGSVFLIFVNFATLATAADTDSLVVGTNGNVGIGTADPSARLEVNGRVMLSGQDPYVLVDSSIKQLVLSGGNGWADTASTIVLRGRHSNYNNYGIDLYTGGFERIRVLWNGNVGIGTPAPEEKLHVAGNIRCTGSLQESDARWKEDIEPLNNALEIVAQLRGVSFNWIDSSRGEGRQVGVIAQEVEQVLPEVVHTDSQGYKSVEYAKLVAPLIEAVKALKDENEALKKENQSMKQNLQKILSRLDALER